MLDWTGITTYAFDPRSLLIGKTDPGSLVQSYSYGANQNRTIVIDPDSGRWTTTYDSLDRRSVLWDADSMGYPVGTIDPVGNQTTVVWNSAHQKLADVDQSGNRTSYSYDSANRVIAVQNARGYVTTTIWNARDAIAAQDALANRWSMSFDRLDRQISSTSPLGFIGTSVYDPARQVVQMYNAMSYCTSFAYDGAGNRVSTYAASSPCAWADPTGEIIPIIIIGIGVLVLGALVLGGCSAGGSGGGYQPVPDYPGRPELPAHNSPCPSNSGCRSMCSGLMAPYNAINAAPGCMICCHAIYWAAGEDALKECLIECEQMYSNPLTPPPSAPPCRCP